LPPKITARGKGRRLDRDMGLQEEEDYNNTNWEWRKKIAPTDQLSNNLFSKS